jgi:hypothetical protein
MTGRTRVIRPRLGGGMTCPFASTGRHLKDKNMLKFCAGGFFNNEERDIDLLMDLPVSEAKVPYRAIPGPPLRTERHDPWSLATNQEEALRPAGRQPVSMPLQPPKKSGER